VPEGFDDLHPRTGQILERQAHRRDRAAHAGDFVRQLQGWCGGSTVAANVEALGLDLDWLVQLALPDNVAFLSVAVEAHKVAAQAGGVHLIQPDLVARLEFLDIGLESHGGLRK